MAQVADFGSACCSTVPMSDCMVTTLAYAAPEVVQSLRKIAANRSQGVLSEHGGPQWYSPGSDIWSAGVILAELLSERPEQPLVVVEKGVSERRGGDAEVEAYMAGIRAMLGEIGMLLSETGALGEDPSLMLVQQMVQVDTQLRISADTALRHPWFQSPGPATPALTAHRSAARSQMLDIARAVARAYTLLAGIRGGLHHGKVDVAVVVVAHWRRGAGIRKYFARGVWE